MKNLTVFEAKKMTGVFFYAEIGGKHYAELGGNVYLVSDSFFEAMHVRGRVSLPSPVWTEKISCLIAETV